ncbi:hypothetical protein Tco_1467452 [Tanacetum coccineum]
MVSSGSSSSDEYNSSSSSGSSSSLHEYKIVSSKGPDKYLLKWYEDTSDKDIPEFKFLKDKAKGNVSSSTACCDDTSFQEFPDDDDSSDEDFPDDDDSSDEDFQVKVKKAKTCKDKSLKSTGCKTKDSSDDDTPNSSKSQARTSKGKASYSTAYKTRVSTSSKLKGNYVTGLANGNTWDLIQKKQSGVRKHTAVDGSDCNFGV